MEKIIDWATTLDPIYVVALVALGTAIFALHIVLRITIYLIEKLIKHKK